MDFRIYIYYCIINASDIESIMIILKYILLFILRIEIIHGQYAIIFMLILKIELIKKDTYPSILQLQHRQDKSHILIP